MEMVEKWRQEAENLGFDAAAAMAPETLKPLQTVRDMCSSNRCQLYGRNWTCPPLCGSLEDCAAQMKQYRQGLLLQTIGRMQKVIDTRAYIQTEKRHLQMFREFAQTVREEYPDALCLGSGGCRICEKCAYPEPCRFPDRAYASMEGYGLLVSQVCKGNGLAYYYGEKTITYTACVLF